MWRPNERRICPLLIDLVNITLGKYIQSMEVNIETPNLFISPLVDMMELYFK